MKKFKNVFLAFFVTALTSLNLALPAYAEEATTQTVDSAGFSVSVVGDGTVTLSSGDFTKSRTSIPSRFPSANAYEWTSNIQGG